MSEDLTRAVAVLEATAKNLTVIMERIERDSRERDQETRKRMMEMDAATNKRIEKLQNLLQILGVGVAMALINEVLKLIGVGG